MNVVAFIVYRCSMQHAALTSAEPRGADMKLGNVCVLVQLMFGPCWPMNQLDNNPNIAKLETF